MKLRGPFLLLALATTEVAYAYSISCRSADACVVTCDNGQQAGTMYWNGSQWSDGVRWHKDRDVLAKQIVAAQGTACR
jgi:hypothetical protein